MECAVRVKSETLKAQESRMTEKKNFKNSKTYKNSVE